MRVALAALLLPGAAWAEPYVDLGLPQHCGSYQEASYDRETWFPGAEAGVISLTDPQSVRGLNAVLSDGVMTEEGMAEPVGRVMAVRGPLFSAEGKVAEEVLIIVTEHGIRLLQPCR